MNQFAHVCDASSVCFELNTACYGKCNGCCPAWNEFNQRMLDWANAGATKSTESIWKVYRRHSEQYHNVQKAQERSGNGMYQGAFAFTLTASPADGRTEEDMVKAVRKVMNQRSCPVKRYAWYLEYGDEETKRHPHIHGMYETHTGGVIERKYWKRAWDLWDPTTPLGKGFKGGYHRPVRDDERYSDYIRKQKILGESRDASQNHSPSPTSASQEEAFTQETPVDA